MAQSPQDCSVPDGTSSAVSAHEQIYQPVDPAQNEIRLVRLLAGAFNEPIECVLHTVSLHDHPTYEALSYVWGQSKSPAQIIVNGIIHLITTNLYDALRQLRLEDGPREIWVDAISIDQSNTQERGHQVNQMKDVYKQASNVIAWLGETSQYSEAAFNAFSKLLETPELHWKGGMDSITLLPTDMSAISKLLRQPWWHRVWTLQESILPNNLSFLCGSRLMGAETLFTVSRAFFKHLRTCCVEFHATCPQDLMDSMSTIYILNQYRGNYRDTDLIRLLLEYRLRNCSDPRDKVYGILGLVKDDPIFGKIVPDYHKPVQLVYEEIAKALIRSSGKLDILSLVLSGEEPFPSTGTETEMCKWSRKMSEQSFRWVPDWSNGASDSFRNAASRFERLGLYRACGNSKCGLQIPGTRALKLRGLIAGRITKLGDTADTNDIHASISTYNQWREMVKSYGNLSNEYPTVSLSPVILSDGFIQMIEERKQTMQDAFWLCLCSSAISRHKDTVLVQDLDRNQKLYGTWWKWVTTSRANFDRLDQILAGSDFTPMDMFQVTSDVLISTAMRRFATIEDQIGGIKMMGLVPQNAQCNDQIVLFTGASVPMVTRIESTFGYGAGQSSTFVGDAYIHGLMHGELWNEDLLHTIYLK